MASAPSNDVPAPTGNPGLPPVDPPSGRFIARLFVIPGLIIFVVVLLILASKMLVNREREPSQFLAALDSENADIRWRGASDLAQILKRTEPATLRWKADARFALDIAERLDAGLQRLIKDEAIVGAKVAASKDKNKHRMWHELNRDRDYLKYLASALAQFHAPVGAPILCAIVKHDNSPDLNGNTLQRRNALWALSNMGENAKGFAKMPDHYKQQMIAGLKDEAAASSDSPRTGWARTGLWYVDKDALPTGSLKGVVKVDETLVVMADAEDQFLREVTALAFTYWDGPLAEPTLLKLAQDTGRGRLIGIEEID
jgi:hypothetical protein